MEAWVVEKEGLLIEKQAWLAEIEAWLTETEGLLCLIDKKVKVIKEQATSTASQVEKANKELEDFKNDTVEAKVDAHIINFIDSNNKVAQAYLELDLNGIVVDGAGPKEEEGGEKGVTTKEENAGATEEPTATLKKET